MKTRIEWIPSSTVSNDSSGRFWCANVNGYTRGYVTRLRSGNYEGAYYGSRRFRGTSMQQVARRVVAWANNIYPSQLPR